VVKPEEKPRRGTRPADIKHYLKPLLKQRSDLVLVGHYLLIRPIRHLLRGASLNRTSDKYAFRIWRYLLPLWESPGWVAFSDTIHDGEWQVWQPHFDPLLMDALAHDVFAPLGEITSFQDVADKLPGIPYHSAAIPVPLLLLAGERDRAESYVQRVEESDPSHWKDWAKTQREFLAQDIGDICARFHAREAKNAKALKLDGIWEPSPFPVELPAAERKVQSGEPVFAPEPWIPRPASLLQEMPEQPGDVRFAKKWIFRGWDNPLLVASLSREEAEERHQNSEDYVLAARLPGRLLLMLGRQGVDRSDPARIKSPLPDPSKHVGGFLLEVHGRDFVAQALVFRDWDVDGVMWLSSVDVLQRSTRRSLWAVSFDRRESTKAIWDYREDRYNERPLTDRERGQLWFTTPRFGDFGTLVGMVLSALRSEGYGEIA